MREEWRSERVHPGGVKRLTMMKGQEDEHAEIWEGNYEEVKTKME